MKEHIQAVADAKIRLEALKTRTKDARGKIHKLLDDNNRAQAYLIDASWRIEIGGVDDAHRQMDRAEEQL